ncbi:hypothetical protein [Virgibacillus ndiopensis]|uniref:hypothetical protein n=1 Tax=Virgibacillus ndiopensis TaxID=2004408 RepID=UPI00159BC174|nr:hypothetical protein [Virgibacillus ndiopensis]
MRRGGLSSRVPAYHPESTTRLSDKFGIMKEGGLRQTDFDGRTVVLPLFIQC